VVFKVSPSGQETVLYSFTGGADGGNPLGVLILDSDGNLYGTASAGGTGCGVVYKLDPSGQETVLHTFAGFRDGCSPYAGVLADPAGNLYGAAYSGGIATGGVVYKITPR